MFVAALWIERGDEAEVPAGTVVRRNKIVASHLEPLVDTKHELFYLYYLPCLGQAERLASVLDEEKVGVVISNAAINSWHAGCLEHLASVLFTW